MKVAVLISGQMRTANLCYESIISNLPKGDYYIHAVSDENSYCAELFDPVRLVIEPQKEIVEKPEYTWAVGRYCYSVQGVLKQLYGLKQVWNTFKPHTTKYDWVIRCRADLFFTKLVEPKQEWQNGITVPKFSNFYGLNDRFAIINVQDAEKYFTRIDLLDEYIFNAKGIFHPETFLLWVCQKYNININRTNTLFYTLRQNGNKDEPFYDKNFGDIL